MADNFVVMIVAVAATPALVWLEAGVVLEAVVVVEHRKI